MANSEERMGKNQRDIEVRSLAFAVRIIKLVNALPNGNAGSVIARQLMRSGTSIGANIEEAQGSASRKDFARRINVARGEARETLYWLRLLSASGLVSETRLRELMKETDELVSILTPIVKRSKSV